MGKPPRFKDPRELEILIEEYIEEQVAKGDPVLIIDFCVRKNVPRSTLHDYRSKEGFSDIIKKIDEASEANLVIGALKGAYNPTFSIFLAKNNHNYTDKHEVEQTTETKGTTVIEVQLDSNTKA
jgi:3-mercaptopyruvate sulfurtransferase SseA